MTISKGDGSMGRLIKDGLCPRCHTAAPPVEVERGHKCSVCDLVISQGEKNDMPEVSGKK